MNKSNYFFNFVRAYHRIFLKVLFFEIIYSAKFYEFLPKIKVHNNSKRTDTVPCVYFFLHEISKFLKKENIKSFVDIGSGYGRVVNFLSKKNNIRSYGIEYDKEVFRSSVKKKSAKVKLYCADVFKFDLSKLKSNCYILIDPFKQKNDLIKFLNKLNKIKLDRKYLITVNLKKFKFPKNYKILYSLVASNDRSLKIFKIY